MFDLYLIGKPKVKSTEGSSTSPVPGTRFGVLCLDPITLLPIHFSLIMIVARKFSGNDYFPFLVISFGNSWLAAPLSPLPLAGFPFPHAKPAWGLGQPSVFLVFCMFYFSLCHESLCKCSIFWVLGVDFVAAH